MLTKGVMALAAGVGEYYGVLAVEWRGRGEACLGLRPVRLYLCHLLNLHSFSW